MILRVKSDDRWPTDHVASVGSKSLTEYPGSPSRTRSHFCASTKRLCHNYSTPQTEHAYQQGGSLTKSGVPVVVSVSDLHRGGEGAKTWNIRGRKQMPLVSSMVAEEVTWMGSAVQGRPSRRADVEDAVDASMPTETGNGPVSVSESKPCRIVKST